MASKAPIAPLLLWVPVQANAVVMEFALKAFVSVILVTRVWIVRRRFRLVVDATEELALKVLTHQPQHVNVPQHTQVAIAKTTTCHVISVKTQVSAADMESALRDKGIASVIAVMAGELVTRLFQKVVLATAMVMVLVVLMILASVKTTGAETAVRSRGARQ